MLPKIWNTDSVFTQRLYTLQAAASAGMYHLLFRTYKPITQ